MHCSACRYDVCSLSCGSSGKQPPQPAHSRYSAMAADAGRDPNVSSAGIVFERPSPPQGAPQNSSFFVASPFSAASSFSTASAGSGGASLSPSIYQTRGIENVTRLVCYLPSAGISGVADILCGSELQFVLLNNARYCCFLDVFASVLLGIVVCFVHVCMVLACFCVCVRARVCWRVTCSGAQVDTYLSLPDSNEMCVVSILHFCTLAMGSM